MDQPDHDRPIILTIYVMLFGLLASGVINVLAQRGTH
jgi:hypothetical protein